MNSSHDLAPVTVIGLGPMGRAMVTTLMNAGHPVTVWNRTPSRAAELVTAGATLAPTPADALVASELIILSLTDYPAMYDILGGSTGALAGKVLVNLSSDTPEASREATAWAAKHGASFLTGGVMVPAPMVGTEAAYVYYSGPEALLREHESVLRLLGAPRYVGKDPGLAQLWYQAQLTVFLTALSGLLQAAALVSAAGVPVGDFLPDALDTFTGIPVMLAGGQELAKSLETGVHPGDLSTVLMMGATADHIVRTSETLGVDVDVPKAVKSHYDRTIAAGRGTDNWTALYEVIKSRR
ncbi:NAD(P)-binding domain-containing protein [Sorangium sp. So ce296]|uniref:NAD(P)-dependent oxidoreductase n=1 Tax=Sorangium sp. So ce296 TaxID=3133296 RepID=UPI003F63BC74